MTNSSSDSLDAASPRKPLAEELQKLLDGAKGESITIGDAMTALNERGLAVVLLVVSIPFLIPVPTTFGLSAPAGLGVMLFGLCVAIGKKPFLPQWMAKRKITYGTLERVVGFARRFERFIKPRLKFMTWPGVDRLLGISIIFAGFTLGLPGPNFIPALAVVFLLIGLMERDGVFILLGEIVNLLLLAFLVGVAYLIIRYGWSGAKEIIESWWNSAGPTTQPTTLPATQP